MSKADDHPLVLFDGVCNLCNASVNFIIDHDPAGVFRFAAQQSPAATRALGRRGLPPVSEQSVVLIDQGRIYRRSDAVLRMARRMGGIWRVLSWAVVIPRPVRDWAYDWIAGNRYRWFGRADACRMPTPQLAQRFLA